MSSIEELKNIVTNANQRIEKHLRELHQPPIHVAEADPLESVQTRCASSSKDVLAEPSSEIHFQTTAEAMLQ